MPKYEFISPEGLRQDGRRATEIRAMSARLGVLSGADGSAWFECGNTKVLATIFGPHECHKKGMMQPDRACLSVVFHRATFASVAGERTRKKATLAKAGTDRRLAEWSALLRDTFSAMINLSLYPRSQIDIFVEILNADGSALSVAINTVTLALIDAGIALHDYLVATSVAYFQNTSVLDVNRSEEGLGNPQIILAATGRGGRVTTAMLEGRLAHDRLDSVTELAMAGCTKVFEFMEPLVRAHLQKQLTLRL